MKRSRVSTAMLALVATLALATNASATPSTPVTITVEVTIGGSDNPFVLLANVCDAGVRRTSKATSSVDSATRMPRSSFSSASNARRHVRPHVRVALSFTTFETAGTWSVVDGTGAYDTLRGTGTITGEPQGFGMIRDTFEGSLHFN